MELNNLEKRYRDELHKHETPIDTDEIWANIEGELEEKKKRRFIIWWFFGGLLLLGGSYLIWSSTNTEFSGQKEVTHSFSTQKNPSIPLAETLEEICPEDEEKILAQDFNAETESLVSTRNQTISKKRIQGRRTVESKQDFKAETKVASSNIDLNNPPIIKQGFRDNTSEKAPISVQDASIDSAIEANTTEQKAAIPVDISKEEAPSTVKDPKEKTPNATTDKSVKPKAPKSSTKKKSSKKRASGQFSKKKRKSPWTSSLSPYAEIGLPIRKLQTDTATTLFERRINSEKTLEAFGFGADYQLTNKNGFLLRTGLHYQQITEKLTFTEEKEEVLQANTVVTITVNGIDSIPSFGEAEVTQITKRNKVTYNRYRMINWPIGFGGRIASKKYSAEFVGGLDFNLFYKPSGEYLASATGTAKIDRYFNRKSVGFGFWAGLTLERKLNDTFSIILSPKFKQQLGSVTPKDAPITQKYTILALQLGIRVQL